MAGGVVVGRAALYLLGYGMDVLEFALDGVYGEYGAGAAQGVGDVHDFGGLPDSVGAG